MDISLSDWLRFSMALHISVSILPWLNMEVDILYHEYETEVVIVAGLGTAEYQLDPDEFALKVLHQAVK